MMAILRAEPGVQVLWHARNDVGFLQALVSEVCRLQIFFAGAHAEETVSARILRNDCLVEVHIPGQAPIAVVGQGGARPEEGQDAILTAHGPRVPSVGLLPMAVGEPQEVEMPQNPSGASEALICCEGFGLTPTRRGFPNPSTLRSRAHHAARNGPDVLRSEGGERLRGRRRKSPDVEPPRPQRDQVDLLLRVREGFRRLHKGLG
mmetsp:Transcript_26499/g.59832  ORF Transcript_26499/g.59832 Transcript_26499/m.59832 type:complete len:205 (-) Transcript_26499:408-1022(-)